MSSSSHGGDTHPAPVADGGELRGAAVVLAIGHTASRDAYPALAAHGVAMVPKPFALGFRMEHPQALIDELQLGARLAAGARPSLPLICLFCLFFEFYVTTHCLSLPVLVPAGKGNRLLRPVPCYFRDGPEFVRSRSAAPACW